MAEGFEVRTDALRRYADGADVRGATLADLAGTVAAAELPRGAFGWIPGIGGRTHEAYADLLGRALDGLRTAAGLTAEVADGVRASAATYDAVDAVNARGADELGAALRGSAG